MSFHLRYTVVFPLKILKVGIDILCYPFIPKDAAKFDDSVTPVTSNNTCKCYRKLLLWDFKNKRVAKGDVSNPHDIIFPFPFRVFKLDFSEGSFIWK